MTDAETERTAAENAFARTSLRLPSDEKIERMPFVELASLLSSYESGSGAFQVVEREIKKRLANDQAKINRPNMLWAAGIGGAFALAGVILGAWLQNSPFLKQIASPSASQHTDKMKPSENSSGGNVPSLAPAIINPSNKQICPS